jgi:hypothetical protein
MPAGDQTMRAALLWIVAGMIVLPYLVRLMIPTLVALAALWVVAKPSARRAIAVALRGALRGAFRGVVRYAEGAMVAATIGAAPG